MPFLSRAGSRTRVYAPHKGGSMLLSGAHAADSAYGAGAAFFTQAQW
jgi:hypothetical protein